MYNIELRLQIVDDHVSVTFYAKIKADQPQNEPIYRFPIAEFRIRMDLFSKSHALCAFSKNRIAFIQRIFDWNVKMKYIIEYAVISNGINVEIIPCHTTPLPIPISKYNWNSLHACASSFHLFSCINCTVQFFPIPINLQCVTPICFGFDKQRKNYDKIQYHHHHIATLCSTTSYFKIVFVW